MICNARSVSLKILKIHYFVGAVETPADDPNLLIGDTTRLFKEVDRLPKYSMDQGIEETINWWTHDLRISKED